MKKSVCIEAIRLLQVSGMVPLTPGPAGATYVGLPGVDFPHALTETLQHPAQTLEPLEMTFIEVRAENGEQGLFGPVTPPISPPLLRVIQAALIGQSLFAYEACWEALFRAERHGRSGHYIAAIGAVDCALWDLRARLLDLPVFVLLGGPTRVDVPCYASLLGFEADSDEGEEVALRVRAMGFAAQKWALRDGPAQGERGLARNVARVARLRQTLGKHYALMFDALGAWTCEYAQTMLRLLQPYGISFLEEPVGAAEEVAYQRLARLGLIPLAAGEHLYTRFECLRFVAGGWLDVLQPDIAWCGGLTEALKIAAIAAAHSLPLYPHGGSLVPALHLACARSAALIPALEYHMTIEPKRQFFLAEKIHPQEGKLLLPARTGLGISLEQTRISTTRIVGGEC